MEFCTLCGQENVSDNALGPLLLCFINKSRYLWAFYVTSSQGRTRIATAIYIQKKYCNYSVKTCLIYACHGKNFYPKIPVIHKLTN